MVADTDWRGRGGLSFAEAGAARAQSPGGEPDGQGAGAGSTCRSTTRQRASACSARGRRGSPRTGEPLPRAGRPGRLLDRAGVAMARLRQVDVPAAHAAEGELQASRVTGRHRAAVVPCPHRDRLLAHRAHSERRRHRRSSLPLAAEYSDTIWSRRHQRPAIA